MRNPNFDVVAVLRATIVLKCAYGGNENVALSISSFFCQNVRGVLNMVTYVVVSFSN
jgi:hypothetical protein